MQAPTAPESTAGAPDIALFIVRAAGPGDRWSVTHQQSGKMCIANVKSFAIGMARNWARKSRPSRLIVHGPDDAVESDDEYGPSEGGGKTAG